MTRPLRIEITSTSEQTYYWRWIKQNLVSSSISQLKMCVSRIIKLWLFKENNDIGCSVYFGLTPFGFNTMGLLGKVRDQSLRNVRAFHCLVLSTARQSWWLPSLQFCSYQPWIQEFYIWFLPTTNKSLWLSRRWLLNLSFGTFGIRRTKNLVLNLYLRYCKLPFFVIFFVFVFSVKLNTIHHALPYVRVRVVPHTGALT